MKNPGSLTYSEIIGQHEASTAAWEQLEHQNDWVERYLKNSAFDEVIFIGSGSSYYQALVMASTFRHWLGRKASACPSSEIWLFRSQSTAKGRKLLVGVSRSGESSEVILAIEAVRALPDWEVCGITCHAESAMAELAECLVSPLGAEESTVMTKSFSSMTFMMQAAIAAASGSPDLVAQMRTSLDAGTQLVHPAGRLADRIVSESGLFRNYIYLAMGALEGIAREACLKIKEMSCVWTESFGTLEFRHGPKAIVDIGTLVVLILSEQARDHELKVASEMKSYGAKVLIIACRAGTDTRFADYVFEIGGAEIGDEARATLYLPLLQWLGYYTAMKKNVNPDEPRNLTQVVRI